MPVTTAWKGSDRVLADSTYCIRAQELYDEVLHPHNGRYVGTECNIGVVQIVGGHNSGSRIGRE